MSGQESGHGQERGSSHEHSHEHAHEARNPVAHYWLRAGLLAGFSFYIAHLTKIDKLQYYIVPRMIPYVKYAALALFVLAGYFAYLALKPPAPKAEEPACDCGHDHEPPRSIFKNVLLYGLFAIPLLFGFVLPDKIMGSDAAAVKGMNLNASGVQPAKSALSAAPLAEQSDDEGVDSPSTDDAYEEQTPTAEGVEETEATGTGGEVAVGESGAAVGDGAASEPAGTIAAGTAEEAELDRLFPADQFSLEYAKLGKLLYGREEIRVKEEGFLEMLTLLDLFRDNFMGKTIVISGFVYREEDMGADQFVVSRMAMQCCSADAMPYGFLVTAPNGASYEKDTWITLTAVMGETEYNGNEIINLEAREITKIEAPSDPYVYPYFDDFANLADNEGNSGSAAD